jgi:hypothetical protein
MRIVDLFQNILLIYSDVHSSPNRFPIQNRSRWYSMSLSFLVFLDMIAFLINPMVVVVLTANLHLSKQSTQLFLQNQSKMNWFRNSKTIRGLIKGIPEWCAILRFTIWGIFLVPVVGLIAFSNFVKIDCNCASCLQLKYPTSYYLPVLVQI